MSPYTIKSYGQTIISLRDGEFCPISEEDPFKIFKKKNMTVDVKNSKVYVPNYDVDIIQSFLYGCHNYFEYRFLECLDKYLPDEATIIDIGANIGNHTLYWANERQAKKIYAFEPIPYTFKILEKNVKINNLNDRIVLYNFGLSDKNCDGEIQCYCDKNIGGTRLKKLQSTTQNVIPLKTLDSFKIKEDKIDLLKIDVEGMDFDVLKGAKKTISKYKPIIMIESFSDSFEKTNALLEKLGYKQEVYFGSFEYLYIPKIEE